MRRAAKAIGKWRYKAIFIDFQKTKVTGLDEGEESCRCEKVPKSFFEKSPSHTKHLEKVALRKSSMAELLSGMFTIICCVIFVYIKMFSLEISGPEAKSQLEAYAVVSLVMGVAFFVTLVTSMIFRRLFPGEI
jgi:hypothetical protein